MRHFLFIFITLISVSVFAQNINNEVEFSFKPAGLYFDSKSDTYKSGFQQGALEMSIEMISFKYNSKNGKVRLTARIYNDETYSTDPSTNDTIHSDLSFVDVFKSKRQVNHLIDIETLNETNLQGLIEINTILKDEENIYFKLVGFSLYQLNFED